MQRSFKIAIVGTGNVAFHLARRLKETGHPPVSVLSRSERKALDFISSLGLETTTSPAMSGQPVDFVFLAVTDQHIRQALAAHSFKGDPILLHGSGSGDLNLLSGFSRHYGVLYPFQTFSKDKEVPFGQIPLLIEGNSEPVEQKVMKLAALLGPKIHRVNSVQRLKIHLAAVFACNFTNNLFAIAEELLSGTELGFVDLEHLIGETVEKAKALSPKAAQTGPAVRRDKKVIRKHLENLEEEDLRELYQLHTRMIQKR